MGSWIPIINNKVKEEDDNIDRELSLDSKHKEAVNSLIVANANTIATTNAKDNEQSEKNSWWINELDSLGINKSNIINNDNDKSESPNNQQLEDLTDDIKQTFVRGYKNCYSE